MPRTASRLTLGVASVRIERLQDISEADALAEGAAVAVNSFLDDRPLVHTDQFAVYATPRAWYRELWGKLHGPASWDANPFVVAITFNVHKANIDSLPARRAA